MFPWQPDRGNCACALCNGYTWNMRAVARGFVYSWILNGTHGQLPGAWRCSCPTHSRSMYSLPRAHTPARPPAQAPPKLVARLAASTGQVAVRLLALKELFPQVGTVVLSGWAGGRVHGLGRSGGCGIFTNAEVPPPRYLRPSLTHLRHPPLASHELPPTAQQLYAWLRRFVW